MYCNKCGSVIKNNESFCMNCGNKIENLVKNNNLNDNNKEEQLNSINQNKNKGNKSVIVIFIIVILIILGIIIYFFITNSDENNNSRDDNIENSNDISNDQTMTTTTKTTTTTTKIQSKDEIFKISSETRVNHADDEFADYYYLLERFNSDCDDEINLFVTGFGNLNDKTIISIALDSLDSSSMSYFDLSKIKSKYPNALNGGYGIKYDVVLTKAKAIFGHNIQISDKNYFRSVWHYVSELDAYIPNSIINPNGGTGCMDGSYHLVISSVVENDNKLIIDVYGARNKKGDWGYIKKDGSVIKVSDEEITNYIRQHSDEFDLFELTFIKENNNYIIIDMIKK